MFKNMFNLNKDWRYFDNAASTPPLLYVKEKVNNFLNNYGSIHRGFSDMSLESTEEYEKSRKKILEYVNPDKVNGYNLVFVQNTTDGLNKLSLMFDLSNKNIAVSDIEHSANYLPWQKRSNQVFLIKTKEDFTIDFDYLENILKKKNIFILSLAAASNVSGKILSEKEMKILRELTLKYGTYLIFDCAQYVPHYKLNIKYCDACVFAGHKMYAPYGGGVLIAKDEILKNNFNSLTGGGNVTYIEFNEDSRKSKIYYKNIPYMHEIGTPNGIGAVSIKYALDILYDESLFDLNKHTKEISSFMKEELKDFDLLANLPYKDTPIVLLENTKENKEKLFQNKIAFREGHFCVYNFMKKLGYKEKGVIRLSAGLMTSKEDILYVKDILKNKNKPIEYFTVGG